MKNSSDSKKEPLRANDAPKAARDVGSGGAQKMGLPISREPAHEADLDVGDGILTNVLALVALHGGGV